jgi:catechol 2,3-dioxygenase-like lactoylglutathione lyase family enzyme
VARRRPSLKAPSLRDFPIAPREAAMRYANRPYAKGGQSMATTSTKARVTSFAPQFLIDDLDRSIAYYQKIGFSFDEPWDGFYAIGYLDGLELHLKEAPKNQGDRQWRRDNEHLDASAGVEGIEAFYEQCVANGVTIIKPLAATDWGTKDFYIEDPDGYIVSFGGTPAAA